MLFGNHLEDTLVGERFLLGLGSPRFGQWLDLRQFIGGNGARNQRGFLEQQLCLGGGIRLTSDRQAVALLKNHQCRLCLRSGKAINRSGRIAQSIQGHLHFEISLHRPGTKCSGIDLKSRGILLAGVYLGKAQLRSGGAVGNHGHSA